MNLDEDMGGGGFKFKKREKKHRIKTAAEKPEEDVEEAKPQAAISITEIISQAHHTPQRQVVEHNHTEVTVEEQKQEEEEEAEREAEVEGEREEVEGDKEESNVVEESNAEEVPEKAAEEENATGEDGPKENDTTDATEVAGPPRPQPGMPARVTGPSPKKAPRFKQRKSKEFKSRPPKKGVLGFGDEIPGMDGLGTDITVICPWEAFSHLELHELAQFGII